MLVGFGKHKELTVENIVLTLPDYVLWMAEQASLSGRAAQVLRHIKDDLIPKIDSKSPTEKCYGRCGKTSKYATGYLGNAELYYWWCEECDPYSQGANQGKLFKIRSYNQALTFAKRCGGTRGDYRASVRQYVDGKGCPKRLTANAVAKFFGSG